jgi:hypothetical protein
VKEFFFNFPNPFDCPCGLVIRVPCLQIQRPEYDSRRYRISREAVGLERGPLSLVSTTEELLGRKSSRSSLENREYDRKRSAALTTRHPLSTKFGTNFTDKLRWLGRIVRSRTKSTEFTQPRTRGRRVRPSPSLSLLSRECRILDVQQPHGPPRPFKECLTFSFLLHCTTIIVQKHYNCINILSSQTFCSYLSTHCFENVGSLTSHNSIGLHGLLQG